MVAPDAENNKQVRRMIVELLYVRHTQQRSRLDHVALWYMLRDLGGDLGENDVLTQLQDLFDRGYVTFEQKKNRWTNRAEISLIQLTSKGRDLSEGTIVDPAIPF